MIIDADVDDDDDDNDGECDTDMYCTNNTLAHGPVANNKVLLYDGLRFLLTPNLPKQDVLF